MKPLKLTIPARPKESYPIVVDREAIEKIANLVQNLHKVDTCIVLYDKKVEKIAESISRSLNKCPMIAVPSGEHSKSLTQVGRIMEDLLLKDATRHSLLINVGGGMLTDLGGFVASVFMRGMRYIHVPTSLLGMADAAIGGKTGIDLGSMVNIIGTFSHPEAVIIDIDVLSSLPDTQLSEGLVEVVKMAAMVDHEFFGWLEENIDKVLDRDEQAINVCIQNAVRMKVEVVQKDEKDVGHRLWLNFGHTVGHAVEALSHFSISHGKAVSIGMVCEMNIANTEGYERVLKLLEQLDMPTSIPLEFRSAAMWDVMQNDKKTIGENVRIAVPKKIGTGDIQSITFDNFATARHE